MNRTTRKTPPEDLLQATPVLDELLAPGYPTREELLVNGVEPARGLSKRVRCARGVAGAATFFLAIHIGGHVESSPPTVAEQPAAVASRALQTPAPTMPVPNHNKTIVAPLFEHGEGRGVTGCVVISPPVFLSEDEAMLVIKEELGKHGIKLDKGREFKDVVVRLPVQNIYRSSREKNAKVHLGKPRPLTVDATDQSETIAVQFISREDVRKLHVNSGVLSSVSVYDMKSLAKHLVEEAAGKGERTLYIGVFYDPTAHRKSPLEADPRKPEQDGPRPSAADESKKLLREQVGDFAVWLDKQGAGVRAPKHDTASPPM